MKFHKQALLTHCCAQERGRYALNNGYLTEVGLITTDGRRLMTAPPVEIEDEILDTSACFRLIPLDHPELKLWLKRVPNSGHCLVEITCRNPKAADNEGELVFSNPGLSDLVLPEGEGAWPDYLQVLPSLTGGRNDWILFGFDPDYMIQLLQAFKKVAPVYGKFGVEAPACRMLINRKDPVNTGIYLDVAGGMWALLMPIDVDTDEPESRKPLEHPVRELQETDTIEFHAHATPLPADYFDAGQDEDETIFDEELEDELDEDPDRDFDDDAPSDPDDGDTELELVEVGDPEPDYDEEEDPDYVEDPALVQAQLRKHRI